jgi:excisionase family DNA binding protein
MRAMSGDERGVDIDEVARHLGVNKDSVYRWIEEKAFPAHRVGRLLRLRLSEVDTWVVAGGGDAEVRLRGKRK